MEVGLPAGPGAVDQPKRRRVHQRAVGDDYRCGGRRCDLLHHRRHHADVELASVHQSDPGLDERNDQCHRRRESILDQRGCLGIFHHRPACPGDQPGRRHVHNRAIGDDHGFVRRNVDLLHDGRFDADSHVNAVYRRDHGLRERNDQCNRRCDWVSE